MFSVAFISQCFVFQHYWWEIVKNRNRWRHKLAHAYNNIYCNINTNR